MPCDDGSKKVRKLAQRWATASSPSTAQRTIRDLLADVGATGVIPAKRELTTIFNVDVQDTEPPVHVALTRVGVTNIERMIREAYLAVAPKKLIKSLD